MLPASFFHVTLRGLRVGDVISFQTEPLAMEFITIGDDLRWLVTDGQIVKLDETTYQVGPNFQPKVFVARLGTKLTKLEVVRTGSTACFFPDQLTAKLALQYGGFISTFYKLSEKEFGCFAGPDFDPAQLPSITFRAISPGHLVFTGLSEPQLKDTLIRTLNLRFPADCYSKIESSDIELSLAA